MLIWIIGSLACLLFIFILLYMILPQTVEYRETLLIDAPREQVYDHIRLQERLMEWSAWPEATRSTCCVEGPDGKVGAKTVFMNKGKVFGHQEVTGLEQGRRISMTLEDSGPLKHTPHLDFILEEAGSDRTRVTIDFRNRYHAPFHIPAQILRLPSWVRKLHKADLQGLKRYSEAFSA
ncbi:MAG: SRPBCC family protein [Litorimonas sp.]